MSFFTFFGGGAAVENGFLCPGCGVAFVLGGTDGFDGSGSTFSATGRVTAVGFLLTGLLACGCGDGLLLAGDLEGTLDGFCGRGD